jgi:PST family polysaccharide transporter
MSTESKGATKREVAHGAFWMLLEVGSGEGLIFVVFLVLTRILGPADYGVVSLAGAIAAFAQITVMRGLADAVVARPDLEEDAISTAFWATLATGAIVCGGLDIAASGIALVFGQPLLAPVLRWFSLCLITSALVSVPLAVLRRQLRFSAFAFRAAGGGVVGGLVGVFMAFAGYGVWALVGNWVAQGVAAAAIVWWAGDWRPRLRFSIKALQELSGFSIHAVLGAALETLGSKIDLLIVGLFFDAASVGYYYLIKRVLQVVSAATVYPVWSVSLPVLAKFAGDHHRFNTHYVSFVAAAQAFWLPIVLGFGVIAADLVPMLFGAHWTGAAPVAKAASLMGLFYAVVVCTNQAFCAAMRADLYARLALFQLFTMTLLFSIAGRFNLVAAGYALSASFAVMVPLQLWVLRRATGLAVRVVLKRCVWISVAGGIMVMSILVTGAAAASEPALLRLPLQIGAGGVVYLAGLWLLARPTCLEILALAQAAIASKPASRLTQRFQRVG